MSAISAVAPSKKKVARLGVSPSASLELLAESGVSALRDSGRVYQRGGGLIRVVRDESKHYGAVFPVDLPHLGEAPKAWLWEMCDTYGTWMVATKNGHKRVRCPKEVPELVMGRGQWRLPKLEMVIECPSIRPDGSLLQTGGYDEKTATLYEPLMEFPKVASKPTEDDVVKATERICDILSDFPFAHEAAKSVMVAAILTAVGRTAVEGPTPVFLFDGSTMGVGKGKLCKIIGIITLGKEPGLMTLTDNQEEQRKTITALALGGARLVVLDEVKVLTGAALQAATTTTVWLDRILGVSKMTPALPLKPTWLATGNNVAVHDDMRRRVLPCRLVSEMEHPENRTGFKYEDLDGEVKKRRGEMVNAALTVLRAYFVAGRPEHGRPLFGTFEAWDRVVRGAVMWAGFTDPCDARRDVEAGSFDVTALMGAIVGVLLDLGMHCVKAADIAMKANSHEPLKEMLREAGYETKDGWKMRSLGDLIARMRDRVFGEYRCKVTKPGNVNQLQLVRL
ncbi:MAG: hypothetical protein V2A71_07045 [Candidatus Eisenbacteria bacterium]